MNDFETRIGEFHEERFSHRDLHETLGVVGRIDVGQEVSEMRVLEEALQVLVLVKLREDFGRKLLRFLFVDEDALFGGIGGGVDEKRFVFLFLRVAVGLVLLVAGQRTAEKKCFK